MGSILAILFVLNFIVTIVYMIYFRNFLKLLKSKYPIKFKELGEPTLIMNNSPNNSIRTIKFLFSKDKLILEDSELLKMNLITKNLLIVAIIGFVILLIMSFVSIVTSNV